MIAAFDVYYRSDGWAMAAAVLFYEYSDEAPTLEYVGITEIISHYIPGQFYKRELPCILRLLEQFEKTPDEMLIDGYVNLGDRPGLGQHLFEFFNKKIPVMGVAKSKYKDSLGVKVFRGGSKRPLYVTAAGIDPHEGAEKIRSMQGNYRVPTLLKRVDLLARGKVRCLSQTLPL